MAANTGAEVSGDDGGEGSEGDEEDVGMAHDEDMLFCIRDVDSTLSI